MLPLVSACGSSSVGGAGISDSVSGLGVESSVNTQLYNAKYDLQMNEKTSNSTKEQFTDGQAPLA